VTAGPALRVGQGLDVHAFSDDPARALVLGGVEITGEGARGLAGHSDADAVSHAVADAVLGAAGLGDLGRHMPDAGWVPVNADCTVVAERPRLAPHVPTMAARLSDALGAPVNVKATRAEGLGALGRAEGIACTAVVLLVGGSAPVGGADHEADGEAR